MADETREHDQLWEFAKTRASNATCKLFIGLVVALILGAVGSGGGSYLMYSGLNARVGKIETQIENLTDRQKENNQLLQDIETLLRERPATNRR